MQSITLYKNNDQTQPVLFRAHTDAGLKAKVRDWILKQQPDVCVMDGDGDDPEPVCVLNYCESYREWEFRETLSDLDAESGTLAEMLELFIESLDENLLIQ